MKPKKDSNSDMDEQTKDPLQLVKELVLLIVEARTPDPSVKGRVEGPHCPVIRGRPAHKCNAEKIECIRASEFCQLAQRLWMNGIPVCIDILLLPVCPHGREEAKVTEGTVSTLISENTLLLERWTIEERKRRQDDGLSSNMLLQAVRSYLHFSQISSWLYHSGGELPGLLAYRVYAPGEDKSLDFPHSPDIHRFPMCLATYHHIVVAVSSLPRQTSIPVLFCAQDDTSKDMMAAKPKRNFSDFSKEPRTDREIPGVDNSPGKLQRDKRGGAAEMGNFASGKIKTKTAWSDGQRSRPHKLIRDSAGAVKSLQEQAISRIQQVNEFQCHMPEGDTSACGGYPFESSEARFVGRRQPKQTLSANAIAAKKAENLAWLNLGDGGDGAQIGGDICCDVRTFANKVYEEGEEEISCKFYKGYRDPNKLTAMYQKQPQVFPMLSKERRDAPFNSADLNSTTWGSKKFGKERQTFIGGLGTEKWGEIGPCEERIGGGVKVKKKDGEKDRRIEQRKSMQSYNFYSEEYDVGQKKGMERGKKENQEEVVVTKEDGIPPSIRRKKEQEFFKIRDSLDFRQSGSGSRLEKIQCQLGQEGRGLCSNPEDEQKSLDMTSREKRNTMSAGENLSRNPGKKKSSLSLREATEEEFIRKLSDRLSVASVSEETVSLQECRKRQEASENQPVRVLRDDSKNYSYSNDESCRRSSGRKEAFTDTVNRETEKFFQGLEKSPCQLGKKALHYDATISQLTVDVSTSPDVFEDSDDTPVASPNQTPRHKSMSESLVKSVAEKTIWQNWQTYQENLARSSDKSDITLDSQKPERTQADLNADASKNKLCLDSVENGTKSNFSVGNASLTSDKRQASILPQNLTSNGQTEDRDIPNRGHKASQAISNIEHNTSQDILSPVHPCKQSNNIHPSNTTRTCDNNPDTLLDSESSRHILHQEQTMCNQSPYNSPNLNQDNLSPMLSARSKTDNLLLETQTSDPQGCRKIFEENLLPLVSYDAGSDSFKKVEQSYGSHVLHSPKVLFSYDLPSQQGSEPRKCIDFGEALESEFFKSKIGEAVGFEAIGKYMSHLATLSSSTNSDVVDNQKSQCLVHYGKNPRSKFEQGYLSEVERNERMSYEISKDVRRSIAEQFASSDPTDTSDTDFGSETNVDKCLEKSFTDGLVFDEDFGKQEVNSRRQAEKDLVEGQRMDQTCDRIEQQEIEHLEYDKNGSVMYEDLTDEINGEMESPTLTSEEAKTLSRELKQSGVTARRRLQYENQSKDKELNPPQICQNSSVNHSDPPKFDQNNHNNLMPTHATSITNKKTSAIPPDKIAITVLEPRALSPLSPPLSSSLSSSSSSTSSVRENMSTDSNASWISVTSDQLLTEGKNGRENSLAPRASSHNAHTSSPPSDTSLLPPKAAPLSPSIDLTASCLPYSLPSSTLPTTNANSQDLIFTNNPTSLSKATLSQPSLTDSLHLSRSSKPQVSSDLQGLDSKSGQNDPISEPEVFMAPSSQNNDEASQGDISIIAHKDPNSTEQGLDIISTSANNCMLSASDAALYANNSTFSSPGSKLPTSTKLPPDSKNRSLSSHHQQNLRQNSWPENQTIGRQEFPSCPSSLSKTCDSKNASNSQPNMFSKSSSSSLAFVKDSNDCSIEDTVGSNKIPYIKSKPDRKAVKNENPPEKFGKRGGKKKNSSDKEKRNIDNAHKTQLIRSQANKTFSCNKNQNTSNHKMQLKGHPEMNGNTMACETVSCSTPVLEQNKNTEANMSAGPESQKVSSAKSSSNLNSNSDNITPLEMNEKYLPGFEPSRSCEPMQNGILHHGFSSAKIIQGTLDTKNGFEVEEEEERKDEIDENKDDGDSDVVFYISEQQPDHVSSSSPSLLSSSLKKENVAAPTPSPFRSSSLSADVDLEIRSRADLGLHSKCANETRPDGSRDTSSLPGSPPLHGDPPGWNSVPPHRTVSTPSCMDREVKASSQRSSSKPSVIQQQNCDTACQIGLRKMAVKSASMIFNSRTGLPTQSSPAPLKRKSGGRFDYDAGLLNTRAIKNAFSCSKLASNESDKDGNDEEERKRTLSTSAPASTNCLLGNFEESILNGRIDPVGTVDGFTAEIGASGLFCPKHLHLPVSAFFFALSDDNAPSPYLGHINLESLSKKGYHIPKKGTVQVTLFNPSKTVVKMFVVMYDLSDMPPSSQTFIRQRTVYCPTDHNSTAPSYLRYLIHLRCASSRSGKIYLHTDIRLIFARHKLDIDAKTVQYELKSYTEGPRNPKYSPKK